MSCDLLGRLWVRFKVDCVLLVGYPHVLLVRYYQASASAGAIFIVALLSG